MTGREHGKTTSAMRVYNSGSGKLRSCRRWPPPNMFAKVPAAPRRWSVLVAVTSITGDNCNKPGHWNWNRKIMRRCARRIIPVETNREIAEARGKPERGCDVNGFPLSERHPWFQNDGAGLKKNPAVTATAAAANFHILGFSSANLSQPAANPRQPTGTSANPMWTAIGLRQTAVASRHPQMMPAIGKPWHRGAAAEQRRDLVHVAERPAALAVIEFEQRAAPHIRRRHGGIDRWRRLCRPDRCYRCLGGIRPRLHRRVHLEMFFHVGWQQIIAAQPHCLSTYRPARAVQLLRDLRG